MTTNSAIQKSWVIFPPKVPVDIFTTAQHWIIFLTSWFCGVDALVEIFANSTRGASLSAINQQIANQNTYEAAILGEMKGKVA
jgi:hypothetical protein